MATRMFRAIGTVCVVAASLAQQISVIQTSEAGDKWNPQPSLSWGTDYPYAVYVAVNRSIRYQSIVGFGAAFTDTSAYNVEVFMNAQTKQELLDAYWGPNGLGYSIGRVTINSADYSFQSFNYDNVTDDFSLSAFDHNLTYDGQRVMPFIRDAMATSQQPIRLFGSPWSPPGWMKTNNNMINCYTPCLKNDTADGSYKATWAAYIKAWLDGYKAKGLPMWGLTPQNEPLACQQHFESCGYTGEDMAAFIRDYLGPVVKAAYPDLQIMLYDHNKIASDSFSAPTLADPVATGFLSGVALHWYDYRQSLGLDHVQALRALAPADFFFLNTEACYLQSLEIDWSVAQLYAVDILGDLNVGVGGWMAWNHVLLTGDRFPFWRGGPNHDNTTTFGDPILFEFNATGTQRLIYQPPYYIIGHVSRFAAPGATRVSATGGAGVANALSDYEAIRAQALGQSSNTSLPLVATAFVSPDATTASVVVFNPSNVSVTFKLSDVGAGVATPRAAEASIPARAIQTYWYSL